jgi:hypothetical protein
MTKSLILTVCFLLMTFSAFAQKEAQFLTTTYWVYDMEKMTAAHQTKYADFDTEISGVDEKTKLALTEQKTQDEMVLTMMEGIEMRFKADKSSQIYISESLAMEGTWEITPTTFIMYSEHATEEYQLVEISKNTLTITEKNGGIFYYKAKN